MIRERYWIGLAIVAAVLLKLHYGEASADQLQWILAPTATLVGWMTGAAFIAQSGEGFLSPELKLLIAPSCAGVNFLVVMFLSATFGLMPLLSADNRRGVFLLVSLLLSYLITVAVNALRILISVGLRDGAVGISGLSLSQLHRLEGVVVYVSALSVTFLVARTVLLRRGHDAAA